MKNAELKVAAARQLEWGVHAPRVQFGAPSRRTWTWWFTRVEINCHSTMPTTGASLATREARVLPIFI